MNRPANTDTVALKCRKCDRRIIVERKDVYFAPSYLGDGPTDLITFAGVREFCCPYHDGSSYWLQPEDREAELVRAAKARMAKRLCDDVHVRWTSSPADWDLCDQLEEAEWDSGAYFHRYLELHGVAS